MSDEQERAGDVRYRTNPMPSKWPPLMPPDKPERVHRVTLRCGHTNEFAAPVPQPGEHAWCHRCKTINRVARRTTTEES